jgi:phosphopantothenoylcysteine decarboxylase / phosphopantothenate---cysteine ligase
MKSKQLLLGVTGGIAVYKSLELVSTLKKQGWSVRVIMTPNATRFVSALSFEAISGQSVIVDQWSEAGAIEHIEIGRDIDVFLVAPATANTIAKLAHGLADDVLTTTALAFEPTTKLVIAPAMNPRMFLHPTTQDNLKRLQAFGYHVIEPDIGLMACGDTGPGRYPVLDKILAVVDPPVNPNPIKVLITAGGTQEAIDPVRTITNHSSGKMGYALAQEAVNLGLEVYLVTASGLSVPPGVSQVFRVSSALEMKTAVDNLSGEMDIVIMAAAVSDYRVKNEATHKLKKTEDTDELTLTLVKNPDILKGLGERKPEGQFLIGFAAETGHPVAAAQEKLVRKKADMIIANDVSSAGLGFGADDNHLYVVQDDQTVLELPRNTKSELAKSLWRIILAKRS